MALTVGELVAIVSIDRSDFQRGTRDIDRGLKGMQSTATSTADRVESAISTAFKDASRSAVESVSSVKRAVADLARYGDIDIGVDADTSATLTALRAVDQALDAVDGRDVRAKVDVDARGVLSSLDMLVDGAEKSGSMIGHAIEGAFGVIGKAGPANVAIAASAIQALPVVAQVAASGIVLAVGGAMAAVGIKAAAGSDRVRRAWSELGADLRAELADAAEPLEDSLIRAADVAETTFQRLKPSLARIFKDLVPDIDQFVRGVGEGLARLGPHLEKVGDSFGDMLAQLGGRMPAIMDNLGDMFSTFADMVDDNPQMLANLVEDATELLSVGAEVLAWADDISAAFQFIAGANPVPLVDKLMGGSPQQQLELLQQMPAIADQLELSIRKVIAAAYGVAAGADDAGTAVRNFNDALTAMYDPAAKALDAEIRLTQAMKDAAAAAKEGKLTGLERLQTVKDMTSAIADSARAEIERTGKTKESSKAFLDALPQLLDYAGKNDAAKGAVAALGTTLGITAQKTRDGVLAVNELGDVIKILPNGKKVEIDASTEAGKKQIADFLLYIARQKGTIDVRVRTIYDNPSGQKAIAAKVKARGGIQAGDGGTQYMAAGGVMGGSSMSPPPSIVDKATFLPHSNTVFGEAGKEAFIPYASQHRARALDILAQVMEDLGAGSTLGAALALARKAARSSRSGGSAGRSNVLTGGGVRGMAGLASDVWDPKPAPGQAGQQRGGVNVQVDLSGSTFHEQANVDRIGADVGFHVMGRGPV